MPGTRLDRPGIALIGAVLMLVTGAVDLGGAAAAVDAPTILLLEYLRVGAPVTLLTVAVGGLVLSLS